MTHVLRSLALFFVSLVLLSPATNAQTTYTWGGTTGDWNVDSNWIPAGIPAASDTVVVNGGTVTLIADTEVAGFTIANLARLTGNADLTVTTSLVWSGGGTGFETFSGSGSVFVASTATLRMTGPTTNYQMSAGRILVNDGLALWEENGIWNGEGRFVNNGELVLTFANTVSTKGFIFSSLTDAITNGPTGLMRWTGSGEALHVAGMVNEGTIRIESGVFRLQGFNSTGTTGSGTAEVLVNATLGIGGGAHTLSSVTGDGSIELSFGSLTVAGDYDVSNTIFTGFSILAINGTGISNTLEMAGGQLGGSGDFTVTDELNWSGGTMAGTGTTILGAAVPVAIGGANIGLGDSRTLRVEGASTWTGDADFNNGSAATFENAGTLTSTGAGERRFSFGNFRNEGTVIHEAGNLFFNSGMSNDGLVSISGGTLSQSGSNATGGTDTGRYEIGSGGRLVFEGGNRTLTTTASVAGDGTVEFRGGSVTNNATWQPGPTSGSGIGVMNVVNTVAGPTNSGVLEIEIVGLTPGIEFDQVNVTGNLKFIDTLRVVIDPSFTPAEGDRFLILPASGTTTGSFAEVQLPDGLDAYISTSAIGAELVIGISVANESETVLPTDFALHNAYPNPFEQQTTLSFDVPVAGRVHLALYDILGRQVVSVMDQELPAGRHTKTLDGTGLASGLFLVRMSGADGFRSVKQVVRMK